jgi:hypothetical protein
LRRAPAEITDRRRGERDAAINRQAVFGSALQQTLFDFDRRGLLRDAQPGGEHKESGNQNNFHFYPNNCFLRRIILTPQVWQQTSRPRKHQRRQARNSEKRTNLHLGSAVL